MIKGINLTEEDPASSEAGGLLVLSDDYKRAKRNALLWSAAVILISCARLKDGKTVQLLGSFFSGDFDRNFILGAALLCLIYSAIGYWRAEWRLLYQNDNFTYDKTDREVHEAIDGLRQDILDLRSKCAEKAGQIEALKKIEDFVSDIETYSREFAERSKHLYQLLEGRDNDASNLIRTHAGEISQWRPDFSPEGQISNEDEINNIILKLNEKIHYLFNDQKYKVYHLSDEFRFHDFQDIKKEIYDTLKSAEDTLNFEISFHPNIENNLSEIGKLSKKISNFEKRFFVTFDKIPVYMGIFLAVAFAFCRFKFPYLIDQMM